jgi:hypothetical protein
MMGYNQPATRLEQHRDSHVAADVHTIRWMHLAETRLSNELLEKGVGVSENRDISQSAVPSEDAGAKGNRKWSRFSQDEEAVFILHESGEILAIVVDESFGGIGLEFRSDARFECGDHVRLRYRGAPMAGIVRFLMPADGGLKRIGLEWTRLAE